MRDKSSRVRNNHAISDGASDGNAKRGQIILGILKRMEDFVSKESVRCVDGKVKQYIYIYIYKV